MKIVGSEVSLYRNIGHLTGIQRVMIEVHNFLDSNLLHQDACLLPVDLGPDFSKNRPENYLRNFDPLLARDSIDISEIDCLMILDVNQALQFKKISQERLSRGLKVLSLIHDIVPLLNPEWFPGNPDVVKRNFRIFLQKLISVSDTIIVPSRHVRDTLLNLPWKIDVPIVPIHLGTFLDYSDNHFDDWPGFSKFEISLLYVSTIEPRKNHETLLDAFNILLENGVNVGLTFVGRYGWCSSNLLSKIKNHPQYNKKLFWHDVLDDSQIGQIYSQCNLVVFPSHDEGFGLGIEEALGRRLKVLANEKQVFLERQQPNLYFFKGNAKVLANAILDVSKQEVDLEAAPNVRSMKNFANDLMPHILNLIQ